MKNTAPDAECARESSSSSTCVPASSMLLLRTQNEDPIDESNIDVVKSKKKHSGPRKRRPKKKPEANSNTTGYCASPSTSVASTGSGAENEKNVLCATAKPFLPPVVGLRSPVRPLYERRAVVRSPEQVEPPSSTLPPHQDDGNNSLNEQQDRSYWTQWVIEAAEKERARRLNALKQLQREEEEEILRRRQWAIAAIEREQEAMMREMFLDNMKNTQWFQSTISRFADDYEVVCPNSWFGCTFSCMLKDLQQHLVCCQYRQVPDTLDQVVDDSSAVDLYSYDVVCPNAVLGCKEICSRENLAEHLATCPVNGISREKEWEERLEWRRNVLLATEQERERRMDEQQRDGQFSFGHLQQLYEEQTAMMQVVLHDEIVEFYQHQQSESWSRRPWIEKAISIIKEQIQELWGKQTLVEGYGSYITQMHGGFSDVDLVVFGATEDNHLTCQDCVSVLGAHLGALNSSMFVEISAITRASIPLLKVVVVLKNDETDDENGDNYEKQVRVPFDITFDDPAIVHNGVASATVVQHMIDRLYGLRELTFVLKHFLAKRGLNDPYVGGLSSYGLLIMIAHTLQERGALKSSVAGDDPSSLPEYLAPTQMKCDDNELHSSDIICNARFNAQREKGERVAKVIIQQSVAKQQQLKQQNIPDQIMKKMASRRTLTSFMANMNGDGHEKRPFLLGKLLMDFLQFYGNDFRQHVDTINLLPAALAEDTGMRENPPAIEAPKSVSPPPARLSPPSSMGATGASLSPSSHHGCLMIQDPLDPTNNLGKNCYRVSQVFRDFSDFLSFLTALIVRGSVMTTGKKKVSADIGARSPKNSPLQPPQQQSPPSYRILSSVFGMKTRETRSSLDLTI